MISPRRLIVIGLSICTAGLVQAQVTPGEILLAEMNCVACHETPAGIRARLASRQAPRLGAEGARIQPQHLRAFLEDPAKAKPGTLMPNLLHGVLAVDRAVAADALTHYLLSLQPADPPPAAPADAILVKQGEQLYHRVGCVQCHAPKILPDKIEDRSAASEELERLQSSSVPLGPVAEKYTVASLAAFLLDPVKIRPSGRMPAMKLSAEEALAISAYLVPPKATAIEETFILYPAKAARGKDLYARLNCAACHELDAPVQPAKPLAQLVARQPAGCLSPNPAPHVPKYELTDRQRIVMLAALQNQAQLAVPLEPHEHARRVMTTLNCFACHQRDRRGGAHSLRREYFTSVGAEEFGDAARVPPNLNGAGAKLQRTWIEAVLERGAVARPFMATRMPQFGVANVRGLPAALEQADLGDTPKPGVPIETAPPEAGRELVAALNCASCHSLASKPSTTPALDLATATTRLQPDWFRRYLLDPPAFHPGTRKPHFWPEGKATNQTVLGGDTERQIAAIWHFLHQSAEASPPKTTGPPPPSK
ncbi:MAG TPA: c-type cytochrome [Chthoniobacteraceae bacterium]|nr:c-type cytochrome [Chthoniobacteraceae bacterium]